jgi:hypothetical protein
MRPDVVVDVQRPNLDGRKILRRVRPLTPSFALDEWPLRL